MKNNETFWTKFKAIGELKCAHILANEVVKPKLDTTSPLPIKQETINALDHRKFDLYVLSDDYNEHKEKLTELFNAYYMHLHTYKEEHKAYLAYTALPYGTSVESAKKIEAYNKHQKLVAALIDSKVRMNEAEAAFKK
jgi:hypothetical protein